MKKYNHTLIITAVILLLGSSCKKEGEKLTLKDGSYPQPLTASANNIVITQDQNADTIVHFSWAADFGKKPAITYTLQVGLPSDTVTWANAKTFSVGNNILSYGFTGLALNSLLITMGLHTGQIDTIVLRIRSDANQYNGAASTVAPAFSNTLVLLVTPYNPLLYIPGDYQGWDPSTAPQLNPVKDSSGKYEAYEYMPGTATLYFKYTNARDWDHTNYGDGGNGTFSTDGNAGGLHVPGGGYYQVTANLNNNTWTATKTTWSIIGDATPGGWFNDTPMTYDAADSVWTVTAAMITAGSYKFRANNDWKIDFGIDADGNLKYADNAFVSFPKINNITVPADGTYKITLDLHISGKYTYTAVKQ